MDFEVMAWGRESSSCWNVRPLKSMLSDVSNEMKKVGVNLAVLDGGTSQVQGVLSRWQKGACKGLLSAPEIPSLNLSEASTIVFLSPLMTDTEFTQATGRIVRQGNDAVRRGESVRVIILGSKDTVETACATRIEHFKKIALEIAQGGISTGENGPV